MDRSHIRVSYKFATRILIVISTFAVFTGGLIYILFRPAEPFFFDWVRAMGLENWLSVVRDRSLSLGNIFPQWFIYSMPGGLWAFGYTAVVLSIWNGSKSVLRFFWFGSIPVLVFGFELLQLTETVPGTFCISDMIWSAIGITTGIITACIVTRRNFLNTREHHSQKCNSTLYLESNG